MIKFGIMNFNVSTIVGLYKAIRYNLPVAKRFFTVTGDGINYAQNFRVRIGTAISELLELCDGYTPGKDKLFIMGGPMMGIKIPSSEMVINVNDNCILVLEDEKQEEIYIRSVLLLLMYTNDNHKHDR